MNARQARTQMTLTIRRSDKLFPEVLKPIKEVKGVRIDHTCINRPSKYRPDGVRAIAHAHHFLNDTELGWICLRWKYLLNEPNVLLHEAAHILINFHPFMAGHGSEWQEKLIEIGGTTKPFLIGRSKRERQDLGRMGAFIGCRRDDETRNLQAYPFQQQLGFTTPFNNQILHRSVEDRLRYLGAED